jgi:hypothetical protein
MQLVLRNWANLQLQVSHATENQLHKTVAKWQISSSVFILIMNVIQTMTKIQLWLGPCLF